MEKLLEILTSLHPDVDFESAEDLIDEGYTPCGTCKP